MPTFIALLRGINVGGHRIIPMADLRTMFEDVGAKNVVTYIQSGNVVFTHPARSIAKLTADLESQISKATRFDVAVMVRTAAELAAVIDRNPFGKEDADHLHVSFLVAPIAANAFATIDDKQYLPERFAVVDRSLYMSLPNGLGRSKLALAIGRQKAVATATTRNWRTVTKLHELASSTG